MRAGFTLVELLVVIAILAALMGMVFMSTGKQQRAAEVRRQAEYLEATFIRARNLSIGRRSMHAVVFHIQNEPGSSGAVLNNRSGAHWYRILGPAVALATTNGTYASSSSLHDRIPYAGAGDAYGPDLLKEVAEAWIGDPIVLPARRVRFLALGDLDDGPRIRAPTSNDARNVWYGSAGETTYPRPWFGYFDDATKTLWPWGGYKPGVAYSGFYYQGTQDPDVVGCRNPVARPYMPLDEPRPLVNADWMDMGFAFFPDGRVRALEFNRTRRYFPTNGGSTGIRERCKIPYDKTRNGTSGSRYVFLPGSDNDSIGAELYEVTYDGPEVQHFTKHNRGWHVTLAPDVDTDRTTFASAREAIDSITPAYRVFLGEFGTTEVIAVKHQEGYLDGRKTWPVVPGDWLDSTNAGSNKVWQNCRLGWLHQANTLGNNSSSLLVRGRPINDVVSSGMLVRRVWWLDD